MGVKKTIFNLLLSISFSFFWFEIPGNLSVRQLDILAEGRWFVSSCLIHKNTGEGDADDQVGQV